MSDFEMTFYYNLATEILRQTIEEYRIYRNYPEKADKLKEIEVWLVSPYAQKLSYGNGEVIVRKLRAEALRPIRCRYCPPMIPQTIGDAIMRDRYSGLKYRELVDKYHIPRTTIYRIVEGID